jgi:sulfoxide reductase catalytic subunit YedY
MSTLVAALSSKQGLLLHPWQRQGLLYRRLNPIPAPTVEQPTLAGLGRPTIANSEYAPSISKAFRVDEPETPFQSITHYNNFYEFSTDKEGVAENVGNFSTKNWKVAVDGMVANPTTFDMDDIRRIAPPEERIYRMRCVEAWSMVIP